MNFVPEDDEQLRTEVRTRYAKAALQVLGTEPSTGEACCGPSCCTPSARDTSPITSDLYSSAQESNSRYLPPLTSKPREAAAPMEANIAIGVARAKEHEHATTRTAAVIPVLAILALVEIPAPEISFLSWLSFRGGSLC